MNAFLLKITACLSMLLDHSSYALPQRVKALNVIGRLAFPIFAFQISEGYTHTRDFNKYALRLAVFAVLSQFPFSLLMKMTGGSPATLNIFFTLFMGLMAIRVYDLAPCKMAAAAGVVIASELASLMNTDYGQWGVLLIFVLYVARGDKLKQGIAFAAMVFIKYADSLMSSGGLNLYFIGTLAAVIPILLYNGKQGKKIKYALYVFYPVHILVLYLLKQVFWIN